MSTRANRPQRQRAMLFGRIGERQAEAPSERTEREDARRRARDWLRERDEETTVEFYDEPELG